MEVFTRINKNVIIYGSEDNEISDHWIRICW